MRHGHVGAGGVTLQASGTSCPLPYDDTAPSPTGPPLAAMYDRPLAAFRRTTGAFRTARRWTLVSLAVTLFLAALGVGG